MRIPFFAIVFGLAILSPLVTANARTNFSVIDAERTAGRQIFANHCMACHGRTGVARGLAPSLAGVAGRRAGSLAGFPFSPALKNSGIIWSDDKLIKWIADAPAMVPGAKMPHVTISDPAERIYVREYIKSLSSR